MMIIKSKSYKTTRSFTTVLNYIFRESEIDNGFRLTKFIKGKNLSVEALQNQLLINEQLRLNRRKNNVVLYMDILSFHPRDAQRLTNEKLHQITMKYLSFEHPIPLPLQQFIKSKRPFPFAYLFFGRAIQNRKVHSDI